jgi:hypothetical protein
MTATALSPTPESEVQLNSARLENSRRIACVGDWDCDFANHHLVWSDEIYRILGISRRDFPPDSETFCQQVHPDDLALVHREKKRPRTGPDALISSTESSVPTAKYGMFIKSPRSPLMSKVVRCARWAPSKTSRSAGALNSLCVRGRKVSQRPKGVRPLVLKSDRPIELFADAN